MGSINYLQAIKPDTAYIKKVIEASLLTDWAIRVEYQSGESETGSWQLWDKLFFAVRSAEAVLGALLDCYTEYPKNTIRLNAEKFSPQSRLLFIVYNPQHLPSEINTNPHTSIRQFPTEYDSSSLQVRLRT